jgi:hypothetical protein
MAADVPSGLSLTLSQEKKKKKKLPEVNIETGLEHWPTVFAIYNSRSHYSIYRTARSVTSLDHSFSFFQSFTTVSLMGIYVFHL